MYPVYVCNTNNNMTKRNPKRNRKPPVRFTDEQSALMGRDDNGKINKYHYRKNPYDREYDGHDYDYIHETNEICSVINQNSNTKSCGYEINNFVVENDDDIFEKHYEDEEEEEFEFEDSEEEEDEDEDSEEEE